MKRMPEKGLQRLLKWCESDIEVSEAKRNPFWVRSGKFRVEQSIRKKHLLVSPRGRASTCNVHNTSRMARLRSEGRLPTKRRKMIKKLGFEKVVQKIALA